MLVVLSDFHLADGTAGDHNLRPDAYVTLLDRMAEAHARVGIARDRRRRRRIGLCHGEFSVRSLRAAASMDAVTVGARSRIESPVQRRRESARTRTAALVGPALPHRASSSRRGTS